MDQRTICDWERIKALTEAKNVFTPFESPSCHIKKIVIQIKAMPNQPGSDPWGKLCFEP